MYRQRGITLVELLIVIVVIGILTSIAVPGYRNYVIRANRTEAKATLMEVAGGLERCFTSFNAYDDAGCAIAATLETAAGLLSRDGHYRITGNVQPGQFQLTATPLDGQADDACGNLLLDSRNVRGVSGTKTVEECWAR